MQAAILSGKISDV